MNDSSPFQTLLERYVFTVANTFIQSATSAEQKRLLDLVIDTGNPDFDDRLFRNALDEYQLKQDSTD